MQSYTKIIQMQFCKYSVYLGSRKLVFLPSLSGDCLPEADKQMAENYRGGKRSQKPGKSELRIHAFNADQIGLLWNFFENWSANQETGDAGLLNPDPGRLFRAFASRFFLVEAAGGLVENAAGDMLMIFRHGLWDLPKGKIDAGENAEAAAVREVEEECGIGQLHILHALPWTYHLYPDQESEWVLKKTYWFKMQSESNEKPRPEQKENITRAEWVPKDKVHLLLSNSYRSVADLIGHYMHLYI
jgi:8-oxo-dGTP pyrophosphatase MutT (NUDIX family)